MKHRIRWLYPIQRGKISPPQIFRIILRILPDINSVIWIVSSLPLSPVPLEIFQVLGNHSKPDNYNCFHINFYVPGYFSCTDGWDYRMHRLHLCRGIRLLQRVSWIRHKTIWWWGSSNAGALGNAEYPSLPSLPSPLWVCVVASDKGHIYGSNKTKLSNYAKLNCWK